MTGKLLQKGPAMAGRDAVTARLFRRNLIGAWTFRYDEHDVLTHTTRHGTVYGIMEGTNVGKPFWIGRLYNGSWVTAERELKAVEIRFLVHDEQVGEYLFG